MCYGFDGEAALRRSVLDRRSLLRGSVAALAGVGLASAGIGATAASATTRTTGLQQVPPGLISIQLWTVRDALWGAPGYDATLTRLAEIGYPRVELALGYFGRTAAQLRQFLDGIGIRGSSSHDGISGDAAALEQKIQNAVTLGQSFMVVPYLYSEREDDWKRWAEQMNVEAAATAAAGLRYGYHNHAHEFTIDLGGGKRPWDVLTAELDPKLVHLEVDIYWAVTGGINSGDGVADPEGFTLDVIRSAPQRVLQYHVKDRDETTGDMADLGTGMIDFARIFQEHSVLEYIVENDTPDVTPQQTGEVGYRYLRKLRFRGLCGIPERALRDTRAGVWYSLRTRTVGPGGRQPRSCGQSVDQATAHPVIEAILAGHPVPEFALGDGPVKDNPNVTSSNPRRAWSGRTAWVGRFNAPLRSFLHTETGSARVVLVAAVVALVWANLDVSSYESLWHTSLSVQLGDWPVSHDLRTWVNSGLMTFFFLVAGLELRRDFDIGELRERRRLILPTLAGLGGILLPIAIYLALNAGQITAAGWGAVMATDTALALGAFAVFGPRFSDRLRGFLLTVSVIDDLVAIAVLAIAYPEHPSPRALLAAAGIFGVVLLIRAWGVRYGPVYTVLGVAAWLAVSESGVDPVVVGLVMGLLTYAYAPGRTELQRASDLFRLFREQPTPQLARSARAGLASALSPNERLQNLYHPWASYLIVPLFTLANVGIVIDRELLARAVTSPVTLGVVAAYIVGKPAGIVATSWLVTRLSRNRFRPPVGWAAVTGVGTISGIGFTIALLIATHALSGPALDEAKLGIIVATVGSAVVTWLVFRSAARLSPARRARALLGAAEGIVDLMVPVDPERDHVRGPQEAPVTVVEYGDFECPYCGQAEPVVRELLADFANVRYVWRHLPLTDVHPHAQLAAEAAEAASEQGTFWEMHDLLFAHQNALNPTDVLRYAEQLGLDLDRFREDLAERKGADRIAEDIDSADLSGVSGTPTFFINGRRHHGTYDIDALSAAVNAAFASVKLRPEYRRDPGVRREDRAGEVNAEQRPPTVPHRPVGDQDRRCERE